MFNNEVIIDLVENAKKDEKHFGELYEAVINKIYYWSYNILNHRELAKDLAQESMLNIFKAIDNLDKPENFMVWAYVITKNTCTRYLKKKSRDAQILEFGESYEKIVGGIQDETDDYRPDKVFFQKSRNELVVDFVDNLPTKQKEVIILYYLEEFSIKEIASALGYNESTVKSNLFFGRKGIEDQVTEYENKHNIRLYDGSILLIVGLSLGKFRNIISESVDLGSYADPIFDVVRSAAAPVQAASTATTVGTWISTHAVLVTTVAALSVALVGGAVYKKYNNPTVTNDYESVELDSETTSKGIKEIRVSESEPGISETVEIYLSKEVIDKPVLLSTNNKQVEFEYKDGVVSFDANENGIYQLVMSNQTLEFYLNPIKSQTPIIEGYTGSGSQVEITTAKDVSIDYDKSYVIANDKEYKLKSNNVVDGNITSDFSVFIYTTSGEFESYSFVYR